MTKIILFLAATLALFACKPSPPAYPITGAEGHQYRLIEEAVPPSQENGWVGQLAVYEREGDKDIRYVMTGTDMMTGKPKFTSTNSLK